MTMTARRSIRLVLTMGAALCVTVSWPGIGADGRGQAPPRRERIMYVSALDRNGAPVSGLKATDIVIREDGIRREALRVEPATEPLDLAVLVDTSQAIDPSMQDIRLAIKPFVATMLPRGPVALVTFGDRPSIAVDYTRTLEALNKGIERLFAQPSAGACLLDALIDVCRGIDRRQPVRAAILAILTEGPEFSNRHYDQVLAPLAQSGARFDALVITSREPDLESDEAHHRSIVLAEGTKQSGGQRVDLTTSMGLADQFTRYAAELAGQYRVVYARPDTLIPPKKIEVSAAGPDLVVRGTPAAPRG